MFNDILKNKTMHFKLILLLLILDSSLNTHTVTRGRFGHATAVRDDTTLLIVGGYNGVALKDTLAIKMPGTVAVNPQTNDNTSKCGWHTR